MMKSRVRKALFPQMLWGAFKPLNRSLLGVSQRAQYRLNKEYTLNYRGLKIMILGIFLL